METTSLARTALLAPLPAAALEPFTATAYFRTVDGRSSGEPGWIDAWSGALQDAAPGAFTWASRDTVYLTYGKPFALAFVGFLCALVALRRQDDSDQGRFPWSWRAVLSGYLLLTAGVVGEYWTPWSAAAFFALTIPGLLVLFVTSPFLAARLLRRRVGSRTGAWMLALTLPAFVGLTALGGHLGFPVIWLSVAWALHARTVLAQEPLRAPVLA